MMVLEALLVLLTAMLLLYTKRTMINFIVLFLATVAASTWAVPGSNQRPSRCRRDALNQLS